MMAIMTTKSMCSKHNGGLEEIGYAYSILFLFTDCTVSCKFRHISHLNFTHEKNKTS